MVLIFPKLPYRSKKIQHILRYYDTGDARFSNCEDTIHAFANHGVVRSEGITKAAAKIQ